MRPRDLGLWATFTPLLHGGWGCTLYYAATLEEECAERVCATAVLSYQPEGGWVGAWRLQPDCPHALQELREVTVAALCGLLESLQLLRSAGIEAFLAKGRSSHDPERKA